MNKDFQESFEIFSKNLDSFVQEVNNKKLTLMATDEWSVKDVLCHIVFWHELYAANYKSQVDHTHFDLPEGMSTINKRGVKSLRKYSKKVLIKRLEVAQKSLSESILKFNVASMTYSKSGRTYQTEDFLLAIARHFLTHAKQVRRAK